MKKIKCLDCDKEFVAESEKEAMEKMHPHYMQDHQDVMAEGTEEKKKAWMQKLHQEWEKAEKL